MAHKEYTNNSDCLSTGLYNGPILKVGEEVNLENGIRVKIARTGTDYVYVEETCGYTRMIPLFQGKLNKLIFD